MPGGYFDLVLRHLGTTPEIRAALLEGTDVSPERLAEPDAEITLGQGLRQLRNANRACPPGWGLEIGRALQPSSHGPMAFAAVSAPTLRDAFAVIQRSSHLRHPAFRARILRRDGLLRLEIHQYLALFDEERLPLVETFLLAYQGIVEAVLGRPMVEGRFEIAAAAPLYRDRYRDFFHAEVDFDAPVSAIVVPDAWGELRCPFADSAMFAAASRRLDALELKFDRLDYTAPQVEHLLMISGDSGLPLSEAARKLGLSERTLVRRLHEAGTSFRHLRDAHRRRRAQDLLQDGAMTAAELGYRLGYEDAANFNRACRRWFGKSPGELRQKPAPGR